MIKKGIQKALIFFAISSGLQLFFKAEVSWGEIAGTSFLFLLFTLLYDWASIPYKWQEKK
ncbi:hypothetical protein ACIQZG_22355 [Lysinibacillus sp. NPDC096418]|uniref:hypothetical protein n=1 Tax=Lysinibacillus sp. NPDC096418 TaxID=3364138 RepID=UPI0038305D4E